MSNLSVGLTPPLCAGSYWLNSAIDVQTIPSGADFNVGQQASITVQLVNLSKTDTVTVDDLQVAVCAITSAGQFLPQGMMPSIPNGLSGAGPFPITPSGGAFQAYTWTPQVSDIHFFLNNGSWLWEDPSRLTLHVCVFANAYGTSPDPANPAGTVPEGAVYDWQQVGATAFCSDQHHGQPNSALHRVAGQFLILLPFLAGFAGKEPETRATISVFERTLDEEALAYALAELERAGLGDLHARPAMAPSKLLGIAPVRRAHDPDSPGADPQDFEDVDTTPREAVDLLIRADEVRPMQLTIELNEDEEAGSVHVFDVEQINGDGTSGGFRFITFTAP